MRSGHILRIMHTVNIMITKDREGDSWGELLFRTIHVSSLLK